MRLARGALSIWRRSDIEVYSAELLGIGGADGTEPARWDIAFKVSKGTYIRALARDIGNSLGCPAHVGGAAPHGGRRRSASPTA